jgi:hypothetical protein
MAPAGAPRRIAGQGFPANCRDWFTWADGAHCGYTKCRK